MSGSGLMERIAEPMLAPAPEAAPSQPAAADVMPWQRPWYWCAPGEWPTLAWIGSMHVVAAAGVALVACGVLPVPHWPAFAIAAALLILGGLGTTVAYHRALAHTAARLSLPVEQFLIACAMLNGSGKPRTWVANHRHHHRYSDKPGDISSPGQGFWWAHLRWLWQAQQPDPDSFTPDMNHRRYRIWDRLQVATLAVSLFGGLLWACFGSWQDAIAATLVIGPIRILWALHAQCSVNSICHLGERVESGTSINVMWLAPFHMFQGENWHANHHRYPAIARLGQRWWQIDLGWACLRTLAVARLASRVRSRD